jgi:hypothetical protein
MWAYIINYDQIEISLNLPGETWWPCNLRILNPIAVSSIS